MRQTHTNMGKKEQRQINQLLTKAATEDEKRGKTDLEARAAPQQHRLKKGRKEGK